MKKSFTVETGGKNVADFLSENIETVSAKNIKKQIKQREVRVNGERTDGNIILRAGDTVEIFVPSFMENAPDIRIVYSDENIAVADKPVMCGVETTLTDFMKSRFDLAKPVHRLDMNTTGLVIFALNDCAYDELLKIFKDRTIGKYYSALVWGKFERESDTLTAYLKKDAAKAVCSVVAAPAPGYEKIITAYETEQVFENYSRLRIKLVTGKTHQIRAHMAFVGHPILGDNKYGTNEINRLFPYKFQQLRAVGIKFPELNGRLASLSGKEINVPNAR